MTEPDIKRAVALNVLHYLQRIEESPEPGIIVAEEEVVRNEVGRVLESQGFTRSYSWSDVLNCLEEGTSTFIDLPEPIPADLVETLIQFCEKSGTIEIRALENELLHSIRYDPGRSRLIMISPRSELQSDTLALYRKVKGAH